MARLTSWVYVTDRDGIAVGVGPDSDVPDWAAALITNPKAWADPEAPAPADETPEQPEAPAPQPQRGRRKN